MEYVPPRIQSGFEHSINRYQDNFSSHSLQDHSAKLAGLQNETIAHRPVLENVSLAGHVNVAITITSYQKMRRNDMHLRANAGDPGFNREEMMRFAHGL